MLSDTSRFRVRLHHGLGPANTPEQNQGSGVKSRGKAAECMFRTESLSDRTMHGGSSTLLNTSTAFLFSGSNHRL
ncbi:MAG TPA: hypothetical protein VKQ89_02210, partial [Candidatus Angelobacter sp.]|nr:hypothetical protein [Candidatus Angelobacter sp.]